ncbi:hypothetical protein BU24DRAFT_387248 [Aaosphaeria arxii CBS 175.79]|uniref:Uncharacterized protein n=1 Tax=Aaosphaeria arxii CBS 175.79 TaxID=1450172 RepID=A0A6A5Y453_9PLEO|nr:uncharacterized protein BU24DRAFT_387248 [Aaosphaeria arxii CBS 175.79]KAF2020036.1 hypothetical protein BU24DRAFT_387248 [Aaosphaeria arxii CBS 175.79]
MESVNSEPTVLEYARFHGLCKDYTTEPLLARNSLNSIHTLTANDNISDLPFTQQTLNAILKERLHLTKEAALLLRSFHDIQTNPNSPIHLTDSKSNTRKRARALKQELPLLRSDNELDLLHFGSVALPLLTNLNIPLEPVDVECDEGLEWPSWYEKYVHAARRRVGGEKLSVTREDLMFLQEAVRDGVTDGDRERVIAREIGFKKTNDFLAEIVHDSIRDDSLVDLDAMKSVADTVDSPSSKRKAEDLKVECPLTPPIFSNSPMKKMKSVSFPELLHEYIPELPSKYESGDSVIGSDESFSVFFKAQAEEANRRLNNEKLSDADTTKRVDVPKIDSTLPLAPWDEFSRLKDDERRPGDTELDAQRRYLFRIKREEFKVHALWNGVSAMERFLEWIPFPLNTPSFNLAESLHGEEVVEKLIAKPSENEIANSSTDLWKRDGLRLLEVEEDEEGIDLGDVEEPTDIDALIRKRKLEMEEEIGRLEVKKKAGMGHEHATQAIEKPSADTREPVLTVHQQPANSVELDQKKKERDSSLMFGGMLSVSAAMKKFKQQIEQPAPQKGTEDEPSFVEPGNAVEKKYAEAEFIERDFNSPFSPSKEADLILSPSTGLIVTNLQQVKQRTLPGQVGRPPLLERVIHLQNRYERLVVLVSEGLRRDAEMQASIRLNDARDQEAVAGLEKFTSKLQATISVVYVPGGDAALAHQIVIEMAGRGLPHGSKDIGDIRILQDETLWELFLRRAGLNPYAAQVILASLRVPVEFTIEHHPTESSPYSESFSVFGLQAFVAMSSEERINEYQAVMGGTRILKRVNKLFDQEWPSATNDFQV